MVSLCKGLARASSPGQFRHYSYIAAPLISDPFEFRNTRKIRDSSTVFPKPNFLSFDAFGTLYVPKKPVPEQYHEVAQDFGIDSSVDEIKMKFPYVHSKLLEQFPNYGKGSSQIKSPDDWWAELIVELFGLPHFTESDKSARFCKALVDRFASEEGYSVYEDVFPALEELHAKNIRTIVSSNSDSRAYAIIDSLGLSKYFDKDDIYLSYNVEHEKPSKKFFDAVSNSHISKTVGPVDREGRIAYLENCWHVGDGHEKDFLGAVRSGWNGIFLDRALESKYLTSPIPDPEEESPSCMTKPPPTTENHSPIEVIANNRIIISNLKQLASLFEA